MTVPPQVPADRDVVEAASVAARDAAASAGVHLRRLHDDEIESAERLLARIWGTGDDPVVPAALLKAFLMSDNYVAAATVEQSLVGVSVGFLGRHSGRFHLHSHITGVAGSHQGRNVGFALKQHQRAWALRNAIDEVVWTFDPLVRRNGYFNVAKLGAEIVDYKENFYGDMADAINRHEESDRCVVTWKLTSPAAMDAARGEAGRVEDASGAVTVLARDRRGDPVVDLADEEMLRVVVPEDIVAVRSNNPQQAAAWRRALREVLRWAFERGYVVTAMADEGDYLLNRR